MFPMDCSPIPPLPLNIRPITNLGRTILFFSAVTCFQAFSLLKNRSAFLLRDTSLDRHPSKSSVFPAAMNLLPRPQASKHCFHRWYPYHFGDRPHPSQIFHSEKHLTGSIPSDLGRMKPWDGGIGILGCWHPRERAGMIMISANASTSLCQT